MLKVCSAPNLLRLAMAGFALLLAPMAQAADALPYGSYSAERQLMLDKLPCKWISMNGKDGIRRDESRYDFLCKGGVWATVSLMMDESALSSDGIARVRLLFREWPADVHPGGGEAYVAQEFLQYVIGHFVPADLAKSVQEGFWKKGNKGWRGKGVSIRFTLDDMGNHVVRRLEIDGVGGMMTAKTVLEPEHAQSNSIIVDGNATLGTPIMVSAPNAPSSTMPSIMKMVNGQNQVMMPVVSTTTPPVFANEAAPESQVKAVAPAPVPAHMVPTAEERALGRASAPTNFDAYNKAEQLTRPFEVKALEDPNAGAKITPADAAQDTGLKKAPEPTSTAPTLAPVPTPEVTTPTSAGLLNQSTATPAEVKADTPAEPAPVIDPRFTPERAMPQLRYVPKAQPVEKADEVIKFEDEKSGL